MGTILIVVGLAVVTTIWVLDWVLWVLGYKLVKPKKETPSYISDMERELAKADIELDNSMKELRDELSQVIARELPKVVASGDDMLHVYLLYKYKGGYIDEPSVQITEPQYKLVRRHRNDTKWVDKQLIEPRVAMYAMTYYVGVDYSWDDNQGIMLHISLRRPRET